MQSTEHQGNSNDTSITIIKNGKKQINTKSTRNNEPQHKQSRNNQQSMNTKSRLRRHRLNAHYRNPIQSKQQTITS